jgi:ribose-phosphate pyrophosphokinase
MNNPPILFAGTSSAEMSLEICRTPHTGIQYGSIYHHQFPSGEWYCQLKQNVRGEDVFLIQSICNPANDNLMQLLVMADAARRASAGRITAVIPYFGYQRQDRKDKPRVPISAKLVANMLVAAGVNRVLTMDLHAQQIQGFFDIPCDALEFSPVLVNHLNNSKYTVHDRQNLVVVAPDIGAVKRSEQYAKKLNARLALIAKVRRNDTDVDLQSFVGDVNGKDVLIVDDLTESAGTLIQAARACKERGAKTVTCAVTHACITDLGMTRLSESMPHPGLPDKISDIDMFIHSDTIPHWWSHEYKPTNILNLSVAELFAKAIRNIHMNQSITSLFE